MKLNLLPTSASKGTGVTTAWVLSALISVGSIAAAIGMIATSQKQLAEARDAALSEKSKAEMVTTIAGQADDYIKLAEPYQRNTNLVLAMDKNVPKFPVFFAQLKRNIPSFFRTTSITATPVSDNTVNLTMTGIIKDQSQYNDLVLALMRIKGASGIQRQLISHDDIMIPNITATDTNPKPYKVSEGRIPSGPEAELNYYIAKGGVTGYLNQGGFGSDLDGRRGAMPKYNEVQVALTVPGNLQAPNVRGTLALHGSAPAAADAAPATTASAPATSRPGGRPGGAPGGRPGGAPGGPPGGGDLGGGDPGGR